MNQAFPGRAVLVAAYLLVLLLYALAVWCDYPLRSFSVDSWSYHELAHTFATDDPYRFKVQRSFWSMEYSASFPPGYPYILYLLGYVADDVRFASIGFCMLCALVTPFLAGGLSQIAGVGRHAGFLAGIALLSYRPYLDEVLSARTIPLAVALTLAGTCLLLSARRHLAFVAGGALLGLACLVRFDQLPVMLLVLALAFWWKAPRAGLLIAACASAAAMAPWAIMSWRHFGVLWASDNSWVALASYPVNVTDFPAAATETLRSDPAGFAWKLVRNAARLGFQTLREFLLAFPVLPILALVFVGQRLRNGGARLQPMLWVLPALAVLALGPQLLTGYTDPRYLSLLFLVLALSLFAAVLSHPSTVTQRGYAWMAVTALAVSLLMTFVWVARWVPSRAADAASRERDAIALRKLAACQSAEPGTRYVFADHHHAARFGAQFGGRGVLRPRNFGQLDEPALRRFEQALAPLRYVMINDEAGSDYRCGFRLSERVPAG